MWQSGKGEGWKPEHGFSQGAGFMVEVGRLTRSWVSGGLGSVQLFGICCVGVSVLLLRLQAFGSELRG